MFVVAAEPAVSPPPPADAWLTNAVPASEFFLPARGQTNGFETLRAEAIAEQLRISWSPTTAETNTPVTVFVSVDEPGHWRVRDWRPFPMTWRGANWEATVPVEQLDVPLVYFVEDAGRTRTNVSALRLCRPRGTGLEAPSRLFWPFLEGFELGAASWRLVRTGPEVAPPRIVSAARTGHAALAVSIPPGQRSVTLATTRVRGWQLEQSGATGVRVWLRAPAGAGRANFTLHADAFTTNQVLGLFPAPVTLGSEWQPAELPFSALPKFPFERVDWLTIEFVGASGQEFLLDDLQLLGRWKLELE